MNRFTKLLALLPLLLLATSPAQEASARAMAGPGRIEIKKPFFWQIEKDGRKSYVLGTVHVGFGLDSLPSLVSEKLNSSSIVYTETGKASDSTADVAAKKSKGEKAGNAVSDELSKLLVDQQGRSLSKQIAPEHYQTFKAVFKRVMTSMAPEGTGWLMSFLGGMIADKVAVPGAYIVTQMMYPASYGQVDDDVANRALANKSKLRALDKQDASMNNLVGDVASLMTEQLKRVTPAQLEELLALVRNNPKAFVTQIVGEHYISGDEAAYTAKLNNEMAALGSLHDRLAKDRNEHWVNVIEEQYAKKGPQMFIAAGIAHFLGKDNVLDMLKARGYKVSRMKPVK